MPLYGGFKKRCLIIPARYNLAPQSTKTDLKTLLQSAKKRNVFSSHHVRDSVRAINRQRPGNNRKFLWLLVAIFLLHITPIFGEGVISYLYTYTRYHWEVEQFSTYSTVTSIIWLIGLRVFMPILNKYCVNEVIQVWYGRET